MTTVNLENRDLKFLIFVNLISWWMEQFTLETVSNKLLLIHKEWKAKVAEIESSICVESFWERREIPSVNGIGSNLNLGYRFYFCVFFVSFLFFLFKTFFIWFLDLFEKVLFLAFQRLLLFLSIFFKTLNSIRSLFELFVHYPVVHSSIHPKPMHIITILIWPGNLCLIIWAAQNNSLYYSARSPFLIFHSRIVNIVGIKRP